MLRERKQHQGAEIELVNSPEPEDQYNVAKEIGDSKEKPDFIAKNFLEAVDYVLARIEEGN